MTLLASHSLPYARLRAGVAALALLAAACSTADKKADTAATTAMAGPGTAAPSTDSAAARGGGKMEGMGQMANMTGDADHDFLRMMSDHHKGMILMAHNTKDRKEGGSAVADAKKIDAAQDKELDHMVSMLEKDFKDPYAPKVMPDNQAMADELKGKSGTDYDRTFYQNVIKHHTQAITMVDEYLPKAKNAMLKAMAEKIKADQAKEITLFKQKISKLGA